MFATQNAMSGKTPICFGDNVRIQTTPLTSSVGLAGLTGQVYGETTPSATGVEVIGAVHDDYAINVYFQEQQKSFWFAPELLEYLDHAPGTTIEIASSYQKWVRSSSGEWKTEFNKPKSSGLFQRIKAFFRRGK